MRFILLILEYHCMYVSLHGFLSHNKNLAFAISEIFFKNWKEIEICVFVRGIGVKVLWSIILICLSVLREQPVTGLAWQNQLTPGNSIASARQLQNLED